MDRLRKCQEIDVEQDCNTASARNAIILCLSHHCFDSTFNHPGDRLWAQNVLSELFLLQQLERFERGCWVEKMLHVLGRLEVLQIVEVSHESRIIEEFHNSKMI